ncbi:hypothetical protein SLA2020_316800 [Shorea laevis]
MGHNYPLELRVETSVTLFICVTGPVWLVKKRVALWHMDIMWLRQKLSDGSTFVHSRFRSLTPTGPSNSLSLTPVHSINVPSDSPHHPRHLRNSYI